FVVVGRYEDCQWVLRDPRFGKGEPGRMWEQYGLTESEWQSRFGDFTKQTRSMLGLDPPDHTRLRRLVAKAFTPKTVENLRPGIQRSTDGLLDGLDGTVDVIPELALRLPISVIGEMLGVPERYRDEFQPLIRASVVTLEINASLEQLDAAAAAVREVGALFDQ